MNRRVHGHVQDSFLDSWVDLFLLLKEVLGCIVMSVMFVFTFIFMFSL